MQIKSTLSFLPSSQNLDDQAKRNVIAGKDLEVNCKFIWLTHFHVIFKYEFPLCKSKIYVYLDVHLQGKVIKSFHNK